MNKAYVGSSFDDFLEEEGIAEEAQRATKAAQHSTTPSSGVGAKADKVEAIKSISDLNALLSQKLN